MIETVPSGTVLHRRYRIERILGSGGFGHVYLAIDLANNQQYAVKEYLVTGTSGQEQLQHEASVLSHLSHPNLPAFQDAFTEHGRYYIVLNYIEGNDLTDLIRMTRQQNEAVPISKILGWLLAICDAVMFLHKQRPIVIHRDIKPDNIRITPSGTAILVDMGNAKAAADGVRTLFFIRHQGTPGYAPPEQYPGGSGTDARSDIYALGGTLYFALTAHEPPSVSVRNQSLQQGRPTLPSLQEHLANNPPEGYLEGNEAAPPFKLGVTKPSKPAPRHSYHLAQLATLPPQLLKQLNVIIQKAMELTPKDRYNSVIDFARDLQRVAKTLPTTSPPPPSPHTPSRSFDPNSTQPDLQEVYDAIKAQITKDEASQKQEWAIKTPPLTQNQNTSASCPRCQTPLFGNTSFCSHCGTALSNLANTQMANTNIRDISAEQTLLVRPSQLKQAVATHMVKPQMANPLTSSPDQLNRGAQPSIVAPGLVQVSAPPITQPPIYNQQPHLPTPRTKKPSSSSFKLGLKGALFLMAIFIALVAIIITLIIHY